MATEQRMREQGYSAEEARRSRARAATLARGLSEMDYVGVLARTAQHHEPRPAVGFVSSGMLAVGGSLPWAGEVESIITRPWRSRGGEWWTMQAGDVIASLADGTEVRLHRQYRGVWGLTAAGRTYPSVLAAAIALTPAE